MRRMPVKKDTETDAETVLLISFYYLIIARYSNSSV